MAKPELLEDLTYRRILDHHSTPQDTARVFAQIRPKLAAYTHLVHLGNDKVRPVTIEALITQTRVIYDGPLEVCEDLVSFEIGGHRAAFQRVTR